MSSIDLSSSSLLSPAGLSIPRQADITSTLQEQWRAAFGAQVNLDPRSNNGQLIAIMAERFALLYELVEAVYNASYPSGAEGVAVDNLLALQGLKRLPAIATKTAASPIIRADGVTLYGLVCYGTPGTVVPPGTLVADTAQPAHAFATDAAITIGPAQNAVQTLVLTPAPTSGAFSLRFTSPAGRQYTAGPFNFDESAGNIEAGLNELGFEQGDPQPFSDVIVTRSGTVLTFSFGARAPTPGEPSTAGQPIALITVASNTLAAGTTRVNVSVLNTSQGQPAQGTGSATCTETGPITVLAGAISVVQTPVNGLQRVTNQLDCITGSDVESDAEALARRANLVANQASGPLAAILQRVQSVAGVTAAIAVANSSMASQQLISVGPGATQGSFALTVLGQTTGAIAFDAPASAVQAALRALSGLETATVSGTSDAGFAVEWGISAGGQGVGLAQVANNTTGVPVTVTFGRYPKSVEVVVQGGADSDVAEAIFAATPAGLATYGRPVLTILTSTTAGQASVLVADTTGLIAGLGVQCPGIPPGAQVASISGNTVTLTAAAVSSASNVQATFGHVVALTDDAGNLQMVRFSRPEIVQIFARVKLVTDLRSVPGDETSAPSLSSKFSAGSVAAVQQAVADAVNAVSIGGTISATGSGGVANSFRSIPGVDDVTVYFGTSADTMNQARISLAAEQVPRCNVGDVLVSFS